jgi:hypothetical protein
MAPAHPRSDAERDRILILDFGSQFTQLIARRIREQHVYCEIHPHSLRLDEVKAWSPAGLISPRPSSVLDRPPTSAGDRLGPDPDLPWPPAHNPPPGGFVESAGLVVAGPSRSKPSIRSAPASPGVPSEASG